MRIQSCKDATLYSPESLKSFLTKSDSVNLQKVDIVLAKKNLATLVLALERITELVGASMQSFTLEFETGCIPSTKQTEIISSSIARLTGLTSLTLKGHMPFIFSEIVNKCKAEKECFFATVETLTLDFDDTRTKQDLTTFVSLFDPEKIKTVNLNSEYLEVFPLFVDTGIKPSTMNLKFPHFKNLLNFRKLLNHSAANLTTLTVSASHTSGTFLQNTLAALKEFPTIVDPLVLPCLRKIDLTGVPELFLKDLTTSDPSSLFVVDFKYSPNVDKSRLFYTSYLPVLNHGHL